MKTKITNKAQAENSTGSYVNYSEPGEYIISIEGWYNHFRCFDYDFKKDGIATINEVLTEIIQVSSLITSFEYTFPACSKLTRIPSGLFDNNTSVSDFTATFRGCSNLTSIPEGLFDNNTSVTSFNMTFNGCSALTSIPSGLFDNNTNVSGFLYTFAGCLNLTGETPYTLSSDGVTKIKLWDRNGDNGFAKPTKPSYAFYDCNGLSDYADIPSNWK